MAPLKGIQYYEEISRYLVQTIGVDFAFVGKLNEKSQSVAIQGGWAHNKPMETFSYDLQNTPCKNVIAHDYALYPKEIQHLFPNDLLIKKMGIQAYAGIALYNKAQDPIGILVVLKKQSFTNPKLVKNMLDLLVGSVSAEMERSEAEEHAVSLREIAYFDPLTKLPNRLLLTDRIRSAIKLQHRLQHIVAIGLMDLDGFKEVNDSLGHEAGDYVLVEVAQRIQHLIRPQDTIARLGGDEFVLVLSEIESSEDVARVLLRVLKTVSAAYNYKDKKITSISASIGVTIYPEDNVDDDILLRHADQAMYAAKENGKNRFHFFDVKQQQKVKANFRALKKIEKAIDEDEFELYFQPKLNTASMQIHSVEALIRWNHPVLGTIGPNEFLPLIENDDLIYKFDAWVVKKALIYIQEFKSMGKKLRVSVNVSAKQFKQKNFVDKIKYIADELQLDYADFKLLEFEITETAALESINHTNEIIKECKKLGIEFALDDFGTGYSSLTHLKELHIDTLKIDRSFVMDMLYNSQDMAIVDAVISLSKVFQIEVIGEGAESIEHLLMLFDLGCDTIQGYSIAKPMSFENLEYFLNNFEPDPRWKMSSAYLPSRADFELLLAQSNHKYWTELVITCLKNKDYKNMPTLSYETCRLGKWMNTVAKKYFEPFGTFQQLRAAHKKVHQDVNSLVDKIQYSGYEVQQSDIQMVEQNKEALLNIVNNLREEYRLKEHYKGSKSHDKQR